MNAKNCSDYSLQFNRWFLKPIGAWPRFTTTTKCERIVSVILIAFCYVILLFSIIPCAAYLIFVDNSFYKKVKIFGPMVRWIFGGIHYTNLLFLGKNIGHCVEHLEADWRIVTKNSEQRVMLKHAKFGRLVSIIFAIFVHSGVMSYCIISASHTRAVRFDNETRIIRSLPLAVYTKMIPVDTSPTNEIVLVMQFFSALISDSGGIGFYTLATVLAAHACGQLNVLAIWIKDYVNESGNKKDGPFRKIEMIVQHHLRILEYDHFLAFSSNDVARLRAVVYICVNYSFVARIEDIMTWVCMTELFRCIFAISMLGYYTVMVTKYEIRVMFVV
ncbi:hypothetical protein K0M31_017747 [Melipona bicolor]|uniref:Odorant receptor n=1 Tax=Melipona bicolor TaxID=60889 RepID=A0AA40G680_9HYME|nr:hypothetical protein K0M31_017747 [Melipona bicolor]